jgi:hypothetical protein
VTLRSKDGALAETFPSVVVSDGQVTRLDERLDATDLAGTLQLAAGQEGAQFSSLNVSLTFAQGAVAGSATAHVRKPGPPGFSADSIATVATWDLKALR